MLVATVLFCVCVYEKALYLINVHNDNNNNGILVV